MSETSRLCLSKWKGDIYYRRYEELVTEVYSIAEIFFKCKNTDWVQTFRLLVKELGELSDRMIMAHIRKYLKDFLKTAIKAVNGGIERKSTFKKEKDKTLKLLSMAYCS